MSELFDGRLPTTFAYRSSNSSVLKATVLMIPLTLAIPLTLRSTSLSQPRPRRALKSCARRPWAILSAVLAVLSRKKVNSTRALSGI
jgi:hypothetical protein